MAQGCCFWQHPFSLGNTGIILTFSDIDYKADIRIPLCCMLMNAGRYAYLRSKYAVI